MKPEWLAFVSGMILGAPIWIRLFSILIELKLRKPAADAMNGK